MADKKRIRVVIQGLVQGVNFRMETSRAADKIGVYGWVRNKADGSVEALIEGDSPKVDQMLDWCRKGPRVARVTHVDVEEDIYMGEFRDFSIRYTS